MLIEMQISPIDTTNTMSVDIRLCGNIPRNEIKERFGAPCSLVVPDLTSLTSRPGISVAFGLAETNGCPTLPKTICDAALSTGNFSILQNTTNSNNENMVRGVLSEKHPQQQLHVPSLLQPPTWAVPAKGETRLEVSHLTLRRAEIVIGHCYSRLYSFAIQPVCESLGRQTAVDLTSKKAFRIGRSPSCDIQLIHATSSRRHAMLFHHSNGSCYIVDCGSAHGTFVNGKAIPSPTVTGVVVPFKVRRGSLIRFGGLGAPCFLLKSFSFHLNDVSKDRALQDDEVQQVRRNTRLNALGSSAQERVRGSLSYTIQEALAVVRKRSFDTLSSTDTLDEEFVEPDCKRVRCTSPPVCEELPLRLVSPDLSSVQKQRHVHFSLEPAQAFFPAAVTPDEMSADEDN